MTSAARLSRFALQAAACLLLGSVLSSCSSASIKKALAGPQAVVSYDDLGTPAMLEGLLGPRGSDPMIQVHMGSTRKDTQPRRLNAYNSLLMLRHHEHQLPHTPENEALRERMRKAYSRIYAYYRTRREGALGAPPYFGRGAMSRLHMMPPVAPYL